MVDPPNYQPMDILVHYKGAKSKNLSCTHKNKERKQNTNIEFFNAWRGHEGSGAEENGTW